ncbi:MAG: 2-oxo acid dehydrogenase subunit E2 [Halobacteriaceae archaeon]
MATRTLELPDVGEGVAEGELVEWLVEPGDAVEEDQPVAEVETDKALVEIPSPVDGVVRELHADPGDVVPVGDSLVTFEVDEGSGASERGDETERAPETGAEASRSRPAVAPPSVRRLARELGVDLDAVSGSGPGGRVAAADVRAAAGEGDGGGTESGDEAPPTSRAAEARPAPEAEGDGETPPPVGPGATRERTLAAPATRRLARELGVDLDAVPASERREGEAFVTPEDVRSHAARAGAEAPSEGGAVATGTGAGVERAATPGERVPYRGVRRTIGERMVRSVRAAPQVTHHDRFVVDDLVEWREELQPAAEREGVRLTYTAFVVKAVARALREYPYVNAELDEEAGEILLHEEYNVGVAVATDAGLMVPVVEDADRKGLLEVAEEVRALSERARERTVAREELQGGTFTVTNYGVGGGEYATPILNHPEVAILGTGAIERRPAVEGEGESEAVVARWTLPVSLTIDHRVLDGAVAAAFANRVGELLSDPKLLVLER